MRENQHPVLCIGCSVGGVALDLGLVYTGYGTWDPRLNMSQFKVPKDTDFAKVRSLYLCSSKGA